MLRDGGVERCDGGREIGETAQHLDEIVALVEDIEAVAQMLDRVGPLEDDLRPRMVFHGARLRWAQWARQGRGRRLLNGSTVLDHGAGGRRAAARRGGRS